MAITLQVLNRAIPITLAEEKVCLCNLSATAYRQSRPTAFAHPACSDLSCPFEQNSLLLGNSFPHITIFIFQHRIQSISLIQIYFHVCLIKYSEPQKRNHRFLFLNPTLFRGWAGYMHQYSW